MTSIRVPQGTGPVSTQKLSVFSTRRYSPPSNSYVGQVSQPILSNSNQILQNETVPPAVSQLRQRAILGIFEEVAKILKDTLYKHEEIGFKKKYVKKITKEHEKRVAKKFSESLSKAKGNLKEKCSPKDVGFTSGFVLESGRKGWFVEPFNKGGLLRKFQHQDANIASYDQVKKKALNSLRFNVVSLMKAGEGLFSFMLQQAEGIKEEDMERSVLINRVTANVIDDLQAQKPQVFYTVNAHWWN